MESSADRNRIARLLAPYFANRSDVEMAFLLGSVSTDRATADSDVDVAVLLSPETNAEQIWAEVERIIGRSVDLVLLNDAPPHCGTQYSATASSS